MHTAGAIRATILLLGAALAGGALGWLVARRAHHRAAARLRSALRSGSSLAPPHHRGSRDEWSRLAHDIEGYAAASRAAEREALRVESTNRLQRATARLAHDIRSPLAALEVFLAEGTVSPDTHTQVLQPALGRLRGIAALLSGDRMTQEVFAAAIPTTGPAAEPIDLEPQPTLVSAVIDTVVSALRLRTAAHPGRVDFDAELVPYGLFVLVPLRPFRRALEDLVAALIERARPAGAGTLRFSVSAESDTLTCRIELSDPATGRPGLREPGRSEKAAGLEEALVRLRATLAPLGGTVALPENEVAAELVAPAAPPPSWFLPEIRLPRERAILVVDDDAWVHHMWDRALADVRATASAEIVHCNGLDALEAWLQEDGALARAGLLLVDDGYPGSDRSGLDFLESRRDVVTRAVLVTGRWEEPQVRSRALALGLRLLPKNLVPRIPIVSGTGKRQAALRGRPDAVLIDDHIWIRKGWELSATRAGKRLLTCASMQEFQAVERHLDRSTVLFIDSDLSDEMPGERFAWNLFDAGFTEIYLATGFDATGFAPMPWISGIIGKDPPEWSQLARPAADPLARYAVSAVAPEDR